MVMRSAWAEAHEETKDTLRFLGMCALGALAGLATGLLAAGLLVGGLHLLRAVLP